MTTHDPSERRPDRRFSKREQAAGALGESEEALREANAYLENLINCANAPIIVWDPQFCITYFNHAFELLSGHSEAEVIGQSLAMLFPPALAEDSMALIRKTMTGKRWETVEVKVLHRDESVRTVLWNSATLFAPDGQTPIAAIAQGQDVTEHRRAERTLRESEEKFRSITEQTSDLIAFTDANGFITFASPASRSLFHFAPEEMCGRHFTEFLDERAVPKAIAAFRGARELGEMTRNLELKMKRKDASTFIGELSGSNFQVGGQDESLVIIRDITERKQAEEALRESEESLRGLFDTMTSGCAIYEVRGDGSSGSDYIVKDFNASSLAMDGKTKEQIIGKSLLEIRPAIEKFGLIPVLQRVWQTGEKACFPSHEYVDDHFANWYENRVFKLPTGQVAALYDDVSDRRQTEEDLRESEERHRRLFETMTQGVIYQAANAAIVSANPAAERILGLSLDQMMGRTSSDPGWEATREDGSDFPGDQHPAMVALRTGEPVYGVIMAVRNSVESKRRWITVDAIPQFLPGETAPSSVYTTFADITERKEAEQALRQSEEQLRQSQKMEAVGQLAGGIAHDFNNLLTAILGYSNMILASEASSLDEARADVEEIRLAGERASALTKQILAFSRRQTLRPTVVSLNEVLTGVEPLLRRTLGENIDLISVKDPDLGNVEADVHQFEQVIMNLAVNARDAMASGGRLALETANVELGEEYCRTHPEAAPGSYVRLSVSDTGVGMDEATRERIFEPFFTTKAPGEGTGLGLATVYGIVRQSNGSISVYSEPGKGTSFKIYLPLAAQSGIPAEIVILPRESARGSETVMVVEDEAALRSLIERILGEVGYTTLAFGSAAEALGALERGECSVDLLLTDVMLSGALQGDDLARAVRAAVPDLPVLFISGYPRNAIVHAGRLDEGVNFLEKPFTPEALASMVRQVLDQARPSG